MSKVYIPNKMSKVTKPSICGWKVTNRMCRISHVEAPRKRFSLKDDIVIVQKKKEA